MYKGFYLIIFSIFLLTTSFTLKAQSFCGVENNVIQAGEKITYNVFYNLSAVWVNAGMATFSTSFETLDGRPTFHLKGAGKTHNSYSWIYKVDDVYESFVDTQDLRTRKFTRSVYKSGKKKNEYVRFAPSLKVAFANHKRYDVPACTQDVLSAIYQARNVDYTKVPIGTKIYYDMFIDGEVHQLYIRYLGRQTITTKYGTFKTLKLQTLLVAGTIFKGGENMEIFITDDGNKIPVRINSPILVGSIKVDMVAFQGLKYPLTSLVK